MSLEAIQALSSFPALQAYFKGEEAIAQIKKKSQESLRPLLRVQANLSGRWYVCQVITAPFRCFFAFFLEGIGEIVTVFHQKIDEDLCWFAARVREGFVDYSSEKTQVYLLSQLKNWPQKGEASRLHASSLTLSIGSIRDRRVRELLDFPHRKSVSFQHHKGICSGISVWFLTLYLRTRPFFKGNALAHMEALSPLFKKGGPKEAVFLQSFFLGKFWWHVSGRLLNKMDGSFLGIRVHKKSRDIFLEPKGFFRLYDFKNKNEAKRTLNQMPRGAYILNFPSHQTAFVKINKKLAYFTNSNAAIYMIKGADLGEKFLELSRSSLNLSNQKFDPTIHRMRFFRVR